MMNIIRADIYRIMRGKALYITFTVLLAVVVLNIATGTTTIGFNKSLTEKLYQPDGEIAVGAGLKTVETVLSNADALIFFVMPLFMGVSVAIFSQGAVKNELSIGVSRSKLYFSKLLLSIALCLLLVLMYMLISMLTAFVLSGFEGLPSWEAVLTMVKGLGGQLAILSAFTSVGVFLSFVTRRAAMVNGIYIAFIIVPSLVINLLSSFFDGIAGFLKYEPYGCLVSFVYIDSMSGTDIVRGLIVAIIYILVSTIAGIALFKKAEIK